MGLLYFIRHGQTNFNKENKWMGKLDLPLNSEGLRQVYNVIPSLSRLQIDSIYTSPLLRAFETAELLASNLNQISLHVVPGLRERDLGPFEGLTKTRSNRLQLEKSCFVEPPNKLACRVQSALQAIQKEQNVLIVSHSAIFRCIINELRYQTIPSLLNLRNCEFVQIYPRI